MYRFLFALSCLFVPTIALADAFESDASVFARWKSFNVETLTFNLETLEFLNWESSAFGLESLSLSVSYQDENCETCYTLPQSEGRLDMRATLGFGDTETVRLGVENYLFEEEEGTRRLSAQFETSRYFGARFRGATEYTFESGAYEVSIGAAKRQKLTEISFRDELWQIDVTGDISFGYVDEACEPFGGCEAIESKLSLGIASDGAEYGGSLKAYLEYRDYLQHQYDTAFEMFFAIKPNFWWRPKQGQFFASLWGELGGFRLDHDDNYREDLLKAGVTLGYDITDTATISGYAFTRFRVDQNDLGLLRPRILNGVSVSYTQKF